MGTSAARLNRASAAGLVALSLTAVLVVLWGYTQPLLPDEGTGAHIFQLSVAMLPPLAVVFLVTADWSRPVAVARPLVTSGGLIALAFVALYVLEHAYYPTRWQ